VKRTLRHGRRVLGVGDEWLAARPNAVKRTLRQGQRVLAWTTNSSPHAPKGGP